MYTYEKKQNEGQLKVTISKEEWEKAVESAYQNTKGKYNVQGFRKGKAPRRVIEQTYGDTVFFDDAFEEVVSGEYSRFLLENAEVKPAESPRVKMNSFTVDKGIEATLTFALMPEVTLGSLTGLKAKVKAEKVDEKAIKAEMERFQEAHARYEESEEEVKNGDFATIDFSGSVDGVKFEGGTAKDYRLEIGSHTFIEGFEEQIVGLKKGESKDINVTFPTSYQAEELAGKPAVFAITVKKVERKILPKIDDKFISDTTEFETVDEYKASVKDTLEKRANEKAEKDYEMALIEEVVENSKVEIPHSMTHHEVHHILHDFEHRLAHQGMTLKGYLEYIGKTEEEFEAERMPDAEKNVKTRLVLQKIIEENKLEVSEDELNKEIEAYAQQFKVNLDDIKASLSQDDIAYFENQALMNKLVSFIKDKNKKA